MELRKTRSFNANDIFYFFLIYNLFHFVGSKSVAAEEKRIPRGLKTTLDNTTGTDLSQFIAYITLSELLSFIRSITRLVKAY
jgi:hypothetical protein